MARYGWLRSKPDFRDYHFAVHPKVARALPEKVDLRPQCPPIRNQRDLGACTAFAGDGVFTFDRTRQGLPLVPTSPLFTYYCERDIEGSTDWDAGAEMRDIIKAYVKYGACPEDLWPYDTDKFTDRPPTVCYDAALRSQALTYSAVRQNLCTMQGVLASGFPFLVGFSVYTSFETAEVADTGEVPMPRSGESLLGGHAVVAVGYDNATRRFLMRNSWGTEWGAAGWFTFPYEYLTNPDLSSDFWCLNSVEGGE